MRLRIEFLLCLLCWSCTNANQFSSTESSRRHVFSVWDNLNRQEVLRNYTTICNVVDTILELSNTLPRREKQWYCATSYFIRARAEARLDKPLEARRDILLALESGYRNNGQMEVETVLMESVGKAWFDSVIVEWTTIQHGRQKNWRPEKPIIITPVGQHGNMPLIIALHGGNGGCEEFSSHFLNLPQTISGVFAFPPGPIKYSQVCHAWPPQSEQSDSLIFSVLDSMKHLAGTDSSKVYLIGFSQGAATAIGISLRHPDLIAGAILFSGFTSESFSDSVLADAYRHGLKFYAVSGSGDAPAFLSSLHTLSTRCNQVGVPFYFEERPGMLHSVPLDIDSEVIHGWRWLHENQYGDE